MKVYYLSLVRGLVGYYVKFVSTSMEIVREHAQKYFGRLWCSVYTKEQFDDIIRKFPVRVTVINEDNPIELKESSDWE